MPRGTLWKQPGVLMSLTDADRWQSSPDGVQAARIYLAGYAAGRIDAAKDARAVSPEAANAILARTVAILTPAPPAADVTTIPPQIARVGTT